MEKADVKKASGWFAGRLPDGWFEGAPAVTADGKQIKVMGTVPAPKVAAELKAGAEAGRIARFREETRGERIMIAREAERQFKLPVTWGAVCGTTTLEFTPGGSGRSRSEGKGEEPKKVMISLEIVSF